MLKKTFEDLKKFGGKIKDASIDFSEEHPHITGVGIGLTTGLICMKVIAVAGYNAGKKEMENLWVSEIADYMNSKNKED